MIPDNVRELAKAYERKNEAMRTSADIRHINDNLRKLNKASDEIVLALSYLVYDANGFRRTEPAHPGDIDLPDNPKTPEEVVFALNFGLDIASAKGKIQESGQTVMVPDPEGNMTDILELPELAKWDVINGNNTAALDKLNIYVQAMFRYADASDYNDYSRWENYYESQNRMIVDHKAKGKMKSMAECAKYANTGVTFVCDGDDHVYTAEEMGERVDSDRNAVFRINTVDGAVLDYGEPVIHIDINNPNLDEEQRNFYLRLLTA